MVGGSTAASSNDVDQPFGDKGSHLLEHDVGSLVVLPECVGQTGIGMCANVTRCLVCKQSQCREHVVGTERAVESNAENGRMLYAGEECLHGLTGKQPACLVADSDAEHERDVGSPALSGNLIGMYGSLAVERVEDGLKHDGIYAAVHEHTYLLEVSLLHLVVCHGTHCRIAHVGAEGESLVGWSYGGNDIPGMARGGELVSGLPCKSHGLSIDLGNQSLAMVVCKRDSLAAERIGCDDVGTCLQIPPVDVKYYIGTSQTENVVVATHLPPYITKPLSTEIFLGK